EESELISNVGTMPYSTAEVVLARWDWYAIDHDVDLATLKGLISGEITRPEPYRLEPAGFHHAIGARFPDEALRMLRDPTDAGLFAGGDQSLADDLAWSLTRSHLLDADDVIDRLNDGLGSGHEALEARAFPWLGAGLLFLNIMAPDGTFDLSAARRTIRQAEDIGLEADQIVFEAAERNRYSNIDLAAAQLMKLRNAGVRIAIDDVGDGYSSLRVATSFKPDVLKLTGDLIAALPSTEATAIIRAVVDLAHRTGAWVVAEGVETEAQAKALRTLEVDWGQGLLFGAPEVRPAG
ncbi:MAG: EAL domain-containing protein, partial [Actinomycetota bacterium]